MKRSFSCVSLLLVGALFASTSSAQDTPDPVVDTTEVVTEVTEVAEDSVVTMEDAVAVEFVVDEAPDDMTVRLRGRLTESVDEEWYVFEDETGTIRARIDDDVFSPDQFHEGIEVEIMGEVDKDDGESTVIEVELVNVV